MEDLVHKGHRQRMRRKFSDFGSRVFDTYELLEMLLYNTVPVKDTNPIAKRLLKRFGSLDGVLSADVDSLREVEGVGAKTAEMIVLAGELLERCENERGDSTDKPEISNYEELGEYLVNYYGGREDKSILFLSFDNRMKLIAVDELYQLDFSSGAVVPKPFLDAGLPVFLDKPLCDNRDDLEFFRNAIQNGAKLLSSSCMRYSKEIAPYFHGNYREIGELRFINIGMAKKWETYGIHALEALCAVTGCGYISIRNISTDQRNLVHLKHKAGFDAIIANSYDLAYDPTIRLHGTLGTADIQIKDTYASFRNQLAAFVNYLRTEQSPIPFAETEELMKLVIGGIESREQGGKEIFL